jgi:hypothetical protein
MTVGDRIKKLGNNRKAGQIVTLCQLPPTEVGGLQLT